MVGRCGEGVPSPQSTLFIIELNFVFPEQVRSRAFLIECNSVIQLIFNLSKQFNTNFSLKINNYRTQVPRSFTLYFLNKTESTNCLLMLPTNQQTIQLSKVVCKSPNLLTSALIAPRIKQCNSIRFELSSRGEERLHPLTKRQTLLNINDNGNYFFDNTPRHPLLSSITVASVKYCC